MISVLIPTRQRRADLKRLLESLEATVERPDDVEVVIYVDEDDDSYEGLESRFLTAIAAGPRIVLSQMWNACWANSERDIGMVCGDDIIFRTQGWDSRIREEFAKYPDRIVMVHGNDLSPHKGTLATHPFLSSEWVEATGHFLPPYFSCDMNDVWITEVAKAIDRKVYLEDVVTEHMHYSLGKAPKDKTAEEREARGRTDKVVELYHSLAGERQANVEALRAAIDSSRSAEVT